jgi:micrococcal nuclease
MTKRHAQAIFTIFVVVILGLAYLATHKLNVQLPSLPTLSTPKTTINTAPINASYYPVTHFTDGDTIGVTINGTQETIRLIGVDTPETKKPGSPIQCYGPEASSFTKTLIGSQPVRLAADSRSDDRDRYGRLLRYVYIGDGTLVNQKIISEGYGFAYTVFPFDKETTFSASQEDARASHRGLWAACQPILDGSHWQSNNL